MRFLPFERLTFRCEHPLDVVASKLAGLIAPSRLRSTGATAPFLGWIKGNHFKFVLARKPILGFNRDKSWQPVVEGSLTPAHNGTDLQLRVRMPIPAAIHSVFWFGSGLSVAGTMVARLLNANAPKIPYFGRREAALVLAIAGATLLVSGVIVIVGFWRETRRTCNVLCEGLGCHPSRRPLRQ